MAQRAIFLQEFLGTDSTIEHFIFGQPAAVTAVLSVNIQCTSEEPEVSRASGLTRPESPGTMLNLASRLSCTAQC